MREFGPALLCVALFSLPLPASAEETSPAACAAYDIHLLTKIEDLASEGVHGSQPAEWFTGLQVARALCKDQRVPESIALYTGMEQILPPLQTSTATATTAPTATATIAASTAPTSTPTIAAQPAGAGTAAVGTPSLDIVGVEIDLGPDKDLPVPLVEIK